MSDKVFVDTNILVYASDADAGDKRTRAGDVLRELWSTRSGVLSPQVLQEFYVSVTRKLRTPVATDSARRIVAAYSAWCIDITPAEIAVAFQIEDEARLSFWDSLIVAAARKAGAKRIFTEDLNPGQIIAGIEIHNPLR
jgi:predicted nucleic acid-binding protein